MSSEIRVVVMGDNHGRLGDKDTLSQILSFTKDFKPHFRWHLGDNWDYACLREAVKKDEREASWNVLEEDFHAGAEWLNKFRPTHFSPGNHDARVRKHILKTDSVTKLDALQKLQRRMDKVIRQAGVKKIAPYIARRSLLNIGPLWGGHGMGGNALRWATAMHQGHGTALIAGHFHVANQINLPRYGGGVFWQVGCSCEVEMEYSETHIASMAHQNSFMAFIIKGDHYVGRQAHKFNGRWEMPFNK